MTQEPSFGWTMDPDILAVLEALLGTEDEQLLSNRKEGGVHCVWLWPMGTWDDFDTVEVVRDASEPTFSRVDVAHGRYLQDGVTFLVWDDECVRAGTLEDARWIQQGVRGETDRLKVRAHTEAFVQLRAELGHYVTGRSVLGAWDPARVAADLARRAEAFKDEPLRVQALMPLLAQVEDAARRHYGARPQ